MGSGNSWLPTSFDAPLTVTCISGVRAGSLAVTR